MKTYVLLFAFLMTTLAHAQHVFEFDTYNSDDSLVEASFDSINLDSGFIYDLNIEGTYSIWGTPAWLDPCGTIDSAPMYPSPTGFMTGIVSCDMEYFFAYPTTYLCDTASFPNGTPRMEISLDNGQTWFHPTTTDTFNSAHTYNYRVTGLGFPLGVRQNASANSDDYGILKFTLTPWAAVGMQPATEPADFVIYPNPAHQRVHIKNTDLRVESISIRNMSGQEMRIDYSLERQISLDLSTLSEGMYIILLTARDHTVSKRIILN